MLSGFNSAKLLSKLSFRVNRYNDAVSPDRIVSELQKKHLLPISWTISNSFLYPSPKAENPLSFVAKLFGKFQLVYPDSFNFPPARLLPPSVEINF